MKRLLCILIMYSVSIGTFAASTTQITAIFNGVYDGDTIDIQYIGLPAPLNKMRVRIKGIDTPEIGRPSRCPLESDLAIKAKNQLVSFMPVIGQPITIYSIQWDNYGGLILGELHTVDGQNVKELMISSALAYAYAGEGQRKDWCVSQ